MFSIRTVLASVAALAFASAVGAAPVSLGIASQFNLVSFGDFKASGSDVDGAVAVAGNMTASGYSVNAVNSPFAGYALVVGGDLNYGNGSINNGNAYVGGSHTGASLGFKGTWSNGNAPLSFASVETQMEDLSDALAGLGATGKTVTQYGGMTFTGTNSAVDIFNLSGSALASVTYANFSNLKAGSTIILNISGTSAGLQGGTPNGLANYNVLYNFFEATSLSFNNVGIYGSILAPLATVKGGSGQINGNVIVGDWDSSINVNANHYFTATDVAGYSPTLQDSRPGAQDAQAVPEPKSLAIFALALALLAWTRRQTLLRSTRRPARATAST